MLENEALKLGKSLYENATSNANNIIPIKEYIEFVGIAIQALEENQQYHAIGTVKELESASKYVRLAKKHGTIGRVIDTCIAYEELGTVEELQALKEKAEKDEITDSDNSTGLKVNWDNFIVGEAELECETIEDAELLLNICKENNIDCNYITADHFLHEPYWYVKDETLETTRYVLDDDSICSLWTVQQFVEEHTA